MYQVIISLFLSVYVASLQTKNGNICLDDFNIIRKINSTWNNIKNCTCKCTNLNREKKIACHNCPESTGKKSKYIIHCNQHFCD